ncbi:MAG: TatD family hydrolase [Bacillota bacterium]|jgi:TatD DNase family protein|nr:TatD family hydrolase [Bacillota bacterium]
MIFETHAHYEDRAFDDDREDLLNSLSKNNIEYVVNVSSAIETVKQSIDLAESYEYIYASVGIHPQETKSMDEDKLLWLKEMAKHKKVVAIGEIGLDYYWDTTDPKTQKLWFEKQMDMAKDLAKPLVIHSRDAANDTFNMIKDAKVEDIGGVMHCFGYGVEQARRYLNMGFYLGIGGVVTFTNGRKLKEVVSYAPIDQLVVETDCPYLSPVPYRGKRNSSLYLPYILKEIATIKDMDYDTVVKITNENAKNLYFKSL